RRNPPLVPLVVAELGNVATDFEVAAHMLNCQTRRHDGLDISLIVANPVHSSKYLIANQAYGVLQESRLLVSCTCFDKDRDQPGNQESYPDLNAEVITKISGCHQGNYR